MATGSNSGFALVAPGITFPQVIVPARRLEILVRYTPSELREATGTLLIGSDDPTAGITAVALHGTYSPTPTLVLEPAELNFDYVPYAIGAAPASRTLTLRIKCLGTGNAGVTVSGIALRDLATGFTLPVEIESITASSPKILPPFDASSPSTWQDVAITFAPSSAANLSTYLEVLASAPNSGAFEISAAVKGSSLGPPIISVTPQTLTLAGPDGAPLPLGMPSAPRQVEIANDGLSNLVPNLTLDDPSGDFSISPTFIAPIEPGQTATFVVLYTPTRPSDPQNADAPKTPLRAAVTVTSNDPDHSSIKVDLAGSAMRDAAADVLALELTSAAPGAARASGDFRHVNLEIESPLGMLCETPRATRYVKIYGGYGPDMVKAPCDEWNKTGKEGHVSWNARGADEESERIVLSGLGSSSTNGRIFTVRVRYAQDCAMMPMSTLANRLNASPSAFTSALGAWTGLLFAVSPDSIPGAIEGSCFAHAGSTAALKVIVNGTSEIADPQVQLRSKGDAAVIVKLRREAGTFTVVQ